MSTYRWLVQGEEEINYNTCPLFLKNLVGPSNKESGLYLHGSIRRQRRERSRGSYQEIRLFPDLTTIRVEERVH